MRFPPVVLLLAACGTPPDAGAPSTAELAGPAWRASVGEQVAVVESAIDDSTGAPIASFAAQGAHVRFDTEGADVAGVTGRLRLGLGGFGRTEIIPLEPVVPELGDALPGLRGPDGAPSRRLEYAHERLTEWFAGTPGGLEHGWTVERRPSGRGALRFELSTDATVLAVSDEAVELLDDGGGTWRYADAAAWDATGRPLDVHFVEGPELALEVDDAGAVYPIDVDPVLTTGDTTLTGPSAASAFGYALANAGDVNGDGYEDVIVGAYKVASSAGRAYVYHGSATGLSTTASTTLSGGYSSGTTPYYYCGGRVAGGADVNNDGYDDVVMACTLTKTAVEVFLGSASGVSTTANATVTGTSGTSFGYAVALVPSVDSDDYAELVVGAYGYASSRGRLYIYSGSAAGTSTTAANIEGSASAYFGFAVDGAGDVDGDGYGDIVASAPGYAAGSGRASVYYGSAAGLSSTNLDSLSGSLLSLFGTSVAGGEDLDGDGYDDIAIGTYSATSSATTYVYTYHGSSSGIASAATTTLSGTNNFGSSLAMLHDSDADGYADLAVGATGGISAYVYPGSASGLSSTPAATLSESGSAFGFAIDGSDVDGDGYTDLVVGDYSDSSTYGKVYVYGGYVDADGDGYGGGGAENTDCDDSDANAYPGATEITADGIDEDCDGAEKCLFDADDDGYLDGSGATVASADGDCSDANEALSTTPATDCDDADGSVNPGATEGVGDGIDQDCDGAELCYDDDDGDGALDSSGDTRVSADTDCTDAHEGLASTATDDCNDGDATVFVGATEGVGDEVDQDCDGAEVCYVDADLDGYAGTDEIASADVSCTGTGEARLSDPAGDCDDGDSTINPGADELCAGGSVDENCDGLVNDTSATDASVWYPDGDSDGFGASTGGVTACDAPAGYGTDTTDCDDTDAAVNPDAAESCGGGDTNCNGLVDDADPAASGQLTWYSDSDGDGAGDASSAVLSCGQPTGAVATATDCDDSAATVYPGAPEVTADGVDQDCDAGDVCYADVDADGYRGTGTIASTDLDCMDSGEADATVGSDCDDSDASVSPSATEVVGDGVDQDCDTLECCYEDADADGYHDGNIFLSSNLDCDGVGEASATVPDGDCDDSDAAVNPAGTELPGDSVDQDCDGTEVCYVDADDDGYRLDDTSTVSSGDTDCDDPGEALGTDTSGDCDDTDVLFHPDAAETDCTDPNDYNCDGATGVVDGDGDGYAACEECDDANAAINPGATDSAGDGIDSDCDGAELCYVDVDADGHRPDAISTVASADPDCSDPGEANDAEPTDDCDDADSTIFPGATEIVADEVDQDCDGGEICYADADNDGYREDATTVVSSDADCTNSGEAGAADPTGDCDDGSAAYHPGASETDCEDPNDYNCDGATGLDDHDGDGYGACEECDDAHSNVNPGAVELCNGIDDDCSGSIDDGATDGLTRYADLDGDGYGDPAAPLATCDEQSGYVADNTDCADDDGAVHPGATDVPGDGVDQDCDGADTPVDGDSGDSGGDSGGVVDETRLGGLFGGCDSTGGAGLAVGGVLTAVVASSRRRR